MSTTPIRLILASASPARRKLLEDSRIAFTVRVSSVDEDAALAAANEQARTQGRKGLTPAETASLLAQLKAQAVAAELAAEGCAMRWFWAAIRCSSLTALPTVNRTLPRRHASASAQ